MTIALIGLVLQATGVFGLVDKYYLKQKVQHAMINYGASDGDSLNTASGGDWLEGGLLGTVEKTDTGVAFTQKELKTFCRLQKKSGQLSQKKRGGDLTYGQISNGEINMSSAAATTDIAAICSGA